ncbi:MAG: DNA polymerase II, partial [Chitinispirillaceae bacterium]|nr:DNA polymerase II [Chitinispirillaceae bacterium]
MEPHVTTQNCFLLTYYGKDGTKNYEINLFAVNEYYESIHIKVTNFKPLFFIPQDVSPTLTNLAKERKSLNLKTLNGTPVDCLYFTKYSTYLECVKTLRMQSIPLFESDVNPVERFLMERFVTGGFEAIGKAEKRGNIIYMLNPKIRGKRVTPPKLSVLSIDIENNVNTDEIYCIACAGRKNIVFMNGSGENTSYLVYCKDEKNMLNMFIKHIQEENPDIIIGWNIISFDIKKIYERCKLHKIPLTIGRGNGEILLLEKEGKNSKIRVDGRIIIDVPQHLRFFYTPFEEYSLNYVASELLGKEKEIVTTGKEKVLEINNLYLHNKDALAHYNLKDAILTREIFEKTEILPNAIERELLSGHTLDRIGGSVAAFDYLYLPRLHREGYVAPDIAGTTIKEAPLPGGFVLEPVPGIYENVLVFDFRSLYPSIIMSFGIDPLAYYHPSDDRISNPVGTSFARSPSILPNIIKELLKARIEAKNKGNSHLSNAIKILMNSFYGVLGTDGCRFFSPEIASTITRTGQYILKKSIEYITTKIGYKVIYGDTDSLFVHIGSNRENKAIDEGEKIAKEVSEMLKNHLKEKFNTESALLLQFESHFRFFLIPAVRGATHGSKKHYCGAKFIDNELKLYFKGMESVRSDWTDLAKEFQY